jgi:hypothetical protein
MMEHNKEIWIIVEYIIINWSFLSASFASYYSIIQALKNMLYREQENAVKFYRVMSAAMSIIGLILLESILLFMDYDKYGQYDCKLIAVYATISSLYLLFILFIVRKENYYRDIDKSQLSILKRRIICVCSTYISLTVNTLVWLKENLY